MYAKKVQPLNLDHTAAPKSRGKRKAPLPSQRDFRLLNDITLGAPRREARRRRVRRNGLVDAGLRFVFGGGGWYCGSGKAATAGLLGANFTI